MHTSVLLQEVVDRFPLAPGATVIDATLGGGGHTQEVLRRIGPGGTLLGIDLDQDAIQKVRKTIKEISNRVVLCEGSFRDIEKMVAENAIPKADGIIFDLGWSSDHLSSGRGFSFLKDEPLIMTLGKKVREGQVTAEKIVNEWSEDDLFEIIHTLGEDRFARRIARMIVGERSTRIVSSLQLGEIIRRAYPVRLRQGKTHPATKTFQALRIVVNGELSALEETIPKAVALLAPKGVLAVISFHSLEDGLVKRLFKSMEKEGKGVAIKKPIVPSREEIKNNPRSRSAKLRTFTTL